MLTVEKIWEELRKEGLNYGLPTVFVLLGPGTPYGSAEDLIRDILTLTRCRWVCLLGEDTTQVGMGTLVKGLSAVGMNVEAECPGSVRDPGWLHSVDRWVIDFVKDPLFNVSALRAQDMIRFTVKSEQDLSLVKDSLASLGAFPGTRYIRVLDSSIQAFDKFKAYDRCRIYSV